MNIYILLYISIVIYKILILYIDYSTLLDYTVNVMFDEVNGELIRIHSKVGELTM